MRFLINRFFLFAVVLLSSSTMFGQTPPAPAFRPPPPRGLPIDDGLLVLFVFSILLAFYKIYNRKKASM